MSLAVLADHMASKGRGPDSMLIHMSPREVQGLQALAMAHGGSLTVNPDTGLPEAGFLDKLLPTILGAGLTFMGVPPNVSAMIVGGIQTVRTGDLGKGIQAGLGAYGGANLTSNMMTAGGSALGADANMLAAQQATELSGLESMSGAFGGAGTAGVDAVGQVATNAAEAATPFEKLSRGFDTTVDQFKNNPMQALKANAKDMAYAFGPAILSELGVKQNMPQTVTKPGMIAPYASFGGQYVAGTPYQATPTRGAEGGLMGMDNGGYGPGQLDFTQRSEPVVRMSEGGKVERFAIGRLVEGGPLTGGAGLDMNNEIYKYFSDPATQALLASGNDKAVAQALQDRNYSLADVAKATGTQDKLADYERRFTQAVNTPTTDATEFLAATTDVGLQNQGLATALSGSGLSAAGQYASTHGLTDTGGILDASGKPVDFYNKIGYTAGALPGDKGGLEGLYANINYSAQGLQDQINAGKLTVEQAQALARGEMGRVGVNEKDIKSATGKDFANLFTGKAVVQDTVTGGGGNDTVTGDVVCGPGYKKSIDGKTCVPDTTVVTQETSCPTGFHYDPVLKQCVKNLDATQTTTTNVTTPTDIATADKSALPVGVSGAGITTINPNGTVSTRPDIPGIPEGGFTGATSLRDAYTTGGGSLGVNKKLFAPTTYKEIEDRYKLTGGSKQAMDYLTGKTKYNPVPYTEDGQIAKSYAESVMKIPVASSSKMYIFKNGKYEINPDYAIPTYDKEGKKSLNLTNQDVINYVKSPEYSNDDTFVSWMTANNLSPEQIAAATGMSIADVYKKIKKATPATTTTGATTPANLTDQSKPPTTDPGSNNEWLWDYSAKKWYVSEIQRSAAGGLMAYGGMAQQFDLGGYSDGGRLLRGPGDGVSDSIPATIGGKRPARLADGEFVVPARIVSELGNGSTEAGARKLYAMMDRVQSARRSTVGKGRVAKNSRSDKYLPA